ncbi:MAG: molybdate ABC transporter substrate-binding protein [Pseudomonas sp.]|uniref:molybdate ABC transporter substrate-binding protein n=1 Tax=Pseudomonas sp. TaxID=306 RepID=UPI003BB67C87
MNYRIPRSWLALLASALLFSLPAHAEKITIAAASDLKFALDDVVVAYRQAHQGDEIEVIYGSSGKFHTQVQQGAPYDLFFSADIAFPRQLAEAGFAGSPVVPYAFGRIVLWSATLDASALRLEDLAKDARIRHVAIANPKHAPYGMRAVEALQATQQYQAVEPKLVYGENIAHTAQFVETGNAQVGIIALALALNPELAAKGGYWLIPQELHEPLEQGFIVTKRAENKQLAHDFAAYMSSPAARAVMTRYGFVLPEVPAAQ